MHRIDYLLRMPITHKILNVSVLNSDVEYSCTCNMSMLM